MELSKQQLGAIMKSTEGFFAKQARSTMDTIFHAQFLGEKGSLPALEVTGLITLAGDYSGLFYFTTTRSLLRYVLLKMGHLDGSESGSELVAAQMDIVGEMANIFAGNLRSELGEKFDISTPIRLAGAIDQLAYAVKDLPYVLRFEHAGEEAMVVIAFDGKRR